MRWTDSLIFLYILPQISALALLSLLFLSNCHLGNAILLVVLMTSISEYSLHSFINYSGHLFTHDSMNTNQHHISYFVRDLQYWSISVPYLLPSIHDLVRLLDTSTYFDFLLLFLQHWSMFQFRECFIDYYDFVLNILQANLSNSHNW